MINKRNLVLAVFLITTIGLTQACAFSSGTRSNSNMMGVINYDTESKITAPGFTARDVVTGEDISLSDYEESMVLLNFVNYGCSASINNVVSRQLLDIKELYDQRDDFVPVSVFCGCCPEDVLRDFAEENGLNWPWILDSDNSIISDYEDYCRSYGYPTLMYVDGEQCIRSASGYSDQSTLTDILNQISSDIN